MPVDACGAAIHVYIGKVSTLGTDQSNTVKSQHSKKIPSYLKLSQYNATVGLDLRYRQQRLEAEGVAASGDVLCLCQTEQQTVNTLTCQTFKPWTINGTCLIRIGNLSSVAFQNAFTSN